MAKQAFQPGVFEYHGCGYGDYWSKSGECHGVTRTEAFALARADGLEMRTIDRMQISSGYTRNWRDYLVTP